MRVARLAVMVVTVLLARPAQAQDAAISVSRGPGADDCPDAEGLAARVAGIRGAPSPAGAAYDVAFTRQAEGLRVEIASGAGARLLHDASSDCTALAGATAVTLALLFDASAEEAARAQAEPPPPPAPLEHEPQPSAPAAEASLEPPHRYGASLSAGGGVLTGVIAPVAPLLALELGVYGPRWRVIAGGALAPARTHALAPGRVEQRLLAASLDACVAAWSYRALRLDACAAGMLAFVHARAQGFDESDEATRAAPLLGAALRFGVVPSPLGAELSLHVHVPLRRQDFGVENAGVAYESAPISVLIALRGALGLSW